ncbi:MAG: hypothetical protein JXR51_10995, partial [Bacteroidales bacterium]|nr:hypothetical protein [Bacteroidales bacterium]MBN2757695.1 hypothetical protein [Bacteroidales bacterium]
MKKIFILIILSFSTFLISNAQVPNSFKYLAVVRNSSGEIIGNKMVSLKISILEGSAVGNPIYSEVFETTTNEFGVVSISIGNGMTVLGNFTNISWGTNFHYLKIEIDIEGKTNYQFMGTSQILAVPYALYALNVQNKDDADANPTNELQYISKNGSTVTLSNSGGSFTDDVNDADHDPDNEIQDLVLTGNTLRITDNPNATPISLSAYVGENTDEQTLSTNIIDNIVQLSILRGNTVNITLPNDFVSKQYGGTFTGSIYASNLNGTNTGDMTDNQVRDAYQRAYSYFMNSSDRNDLDFLALSTGLAVSGSNVNLIAANGITSLILPANGTLATTDYVNNNTLDNILQYGRILVGDISNHVSDLDASQDGQILIGNGSTIRSRGIIGDATLLNSGEITITHINDQNISLGGSFTTTTDYIILRANANGSDLYLPENGTLATTDNIASFSGSTNITTLGTITTGVWHGTDIEPDRINWSEPEAIGNTTANSGAFTSLLADDFTLNSSTVSLGGNFSTANVTTFA